MSLSRQVSQGQVHCVFHHGGSSGSSEGGKRFVRRGIEEFISILSELGVKIPVQPNRAEILAENMRLQIALGARTMSAVAELPIAEEHWKINHYPTKVAVTS